MVEERQRQRTNFRRPEYFAEPYRPDPDRKIIPPFPLSEGYSGPRTRQKLQPRGIESMLNVIQLDNTMKQKKWEDLGGRGPFPVYREPAGGNRAKIEPSWLDAKAELPSWARSGIISAMDNPMVQRVRNVYSDAEPYFPSVDFGDQQLGYDYNTQLWGGNLDLGGVYDVDDDQYQFNLNWGTNW